MSDLTFDEATHTYRIHGKVVPGVTTILKPLTDFSFVKPEALEAASLFGTAVHKACELDDLDFLDEEALDPALAPYLQAWRKFSTDYRAAWTAIEERVYSPTHDYAGTLDRFGKVVLPGTFTPKDAVVDIKSGVALYPAVGPQLAAYKNAIPGVAPTTLRMAEAA